jgi:hypothetical protein
MTRTRLPLVRSMIAAALALGATSALAQAPIVRPAANTSARPADATTVRATPGTVSRVVLVRVHPGQRVEFDRDMMDNLIPVYEEQKKAGILANYQLISNVTSDGPEDWTVGIVLTYPNYAALDGLADRARPINLKHYGSTQAMQAAGEARSKLATVVSSKLMRGLQYSRVPATP